MDSSSRQLFRGEDLEQFSEWRTVEQDQCIACGGTSIDLWATAGSYEAVRCVACGLIWMKPFLNDEGLQRYYANYIGRRRLNNDVKMDQRRIQYRSDREFIEQFISEGKVLDVGCNGGFFLEALSSKFEKHGIDIDPDAVAYAQTAYPKFGRNVLCVALEEVGYEHGSFDMVVMRGTIEHLPDPVGAIRKVSLLLKDGGYYYITATPNGGSFAADLFRDKWALFHPIQHIWHFSPRSLADIGSRFGLKLVAKEFPYLGTPYENVRNDVQAVAHAIRSKEQDPAVELPVSPPFWGSMMALIFEKVA